MKVQTQAAFDWNKAQKLQDFIDKIETQVSGIDNVSKREKVKLWMKWARDKADWLD